MDLAKIGDKVVCKCKGGPHKIISGAGTVFVDDIPAARIGDMTSCGATITTGADWFEIEDSPAAINGSKTSCGGQVITGSSVTTGSPTSIEIGGFRFQQSSPADTGMTDDATAAASGVASPANAQPAATPATIGLATHANDNLATSTVAPGFQIVRQPGTREQIKRRLLASPTPQVDAMFERLNAHLGAYVLPGSMVVLSDPENLTCSVEEEELKLQARQVQQSVQALELPEAQRMVDHFDTYQELVSYGSTVVGTAASSIGRATALVESELNNLAAAYKDVLDPTVKATQEAFIATRDEISQRIDNLLNTVLRKGLNLPEFDVLKAKIGIEAQQAVHHGRTALEGFRHFEIPTIS
ncbi:MAG TPA: PAAR domain-containing protein, partial [Modicisalibacter sp.]|nr:PAAR domain-containing protein [Modicisalibacter sp.]